MPSEARAAAWIVAAVALVGFLAPVLANDRPILARLDGRLTAPALADLPLVGSLFDDPASRLVVWGLPEVSAPPGPAARILLMPPVPYSYRGIRLDESLRPPSAAHPMGTDELGRDLLARVLHGARLSLLVGFGATALALSIGFCFGALAGLRGGLVDLLIVRLVDVVACFPPFVLALAFVAALGRTGVWPMIAGIALSRWTTMARYVRGEILRHRGGEIWVSARAAGAGSVRLVLRHLLPLLAAPLAVMVSFGVANAIVMESALSFLGFGVDPPAPSWGSILAEARGSLDAAWWPVFFPSAALVIVLASLCAAAERAAGGSEARLKHLP
jgi:peptide/nickel transport system permease protein